MFHCLYHALGPKNGLISPTNMRRSEPNKHVIDCIRSMKMPGKQGYLCFREAV